MQPTQATGQATTQAPTSRPARPFRRLWAALLPLMMLATAGCADDPLPLEAPVRATSAAFSGMLQSVNAFTVDEVPELSSQRLVGAEGFDIKLYIREPQGKFIKAYGLKTPFERVVHRLDTPLPMAVRDGYVVLRSVYFRQAPVRGDYPLEFWLVNEAGQESNHVTASVYVQ